MDSPGTWESPPPFSRAENAKRVAPVEGDRRRSAKEAEETYEPVVPMRTGNCGLRCRRTRRREAGNKTTHRSKETSQDTELGERMSEDKILQKAMVTLLNAIYEQDFYRCSYGFRPGKSQQDALNEVGRIICLRPMGWVLEADISGYFDAIVRRELVEMIERRVK